MREFHSSVKPSIPAESSEVVLLQDTVAGVSLTVCERFIRVGETEIPMEHSISFAAASGRFFLVADRREIRVFSVSGETPSVCVSITAGEDARGGVGRVAVEPAVDLPRGSAREWGAAGELCGVVAVLAAERRAVSAGVVCGRVAADLQGE